MTTPSPIIAESVFVPSRRYLGRDASGFPPEIGTRKILWTLLFARPSFKILGAMLIVIVTFTGLLAPYYQKEFIDGLTNGSSDTAKLIQVLSLAVFMGIASQSINLLMRTILSREGVIAQRWLSRELYRHALNITSQARIQKSIGETVSHYATDVQTSANVIDDFFPSFLSSIGPLIGAPWAISYLFSIPATPVLMVTSISLAFCFLLGLRQAGYFYRFKRLAEARLSVVNEWLQNIRVLRILGWVEFFESRIQETRGKETQNRLGMVTNGSVMNAIAQAAPLVINAVGVYTLIQYYQRPISPGDIFAVLWILGVFLNRPLRMIPWTVVVFLDSLTSMHRLENYFALPREETRHLSIAPVTESSSLSDSRKKGVSLRIEGVSLYTNKSVLLHDISLTIRPGEFVAIVGEVGAGKTVLMNTFIRDTSAQFKRFEINGKNVLSLPLHELRSFFSYVPQDGFTMSATIRENILFEYDGDQSRDEEILEALRLAQFSLDKEQLAFGLDTEIGERGVNLSGGQRQRLALARAHLSNRPVLLLDDCLSAVDVKTEEALIRDLLCGAWKHKTRVLVTHRLSSLKHVDRVFHMEKGKLREIEVDNTHAT